MSISDSVSVRGGKNPGLLSEHFSTLKIEAIRSSETSVNTRPTQRHIPEGDILHSHRCESLKSCMYLVHVINYIYV
jgi:hypothetical protein